MKKIVNVLFAVVVLISVIAVLYFMETALINDSDDDVMGGLEVVFVGLLGFPFVYAELDMWFSFNRLIKAYQTKNILDIVLNTVASLLALAIIFFDVFYCTSSFIERSENVMFISFVLLLGLRGIWFAVWCLKSDN